MPPIEQLDNRLLAQRARAEILRAIFDGRFEHKLPREDHLASMLNVSRTTIRAALQDLERDGVVTRRRAIGTLINEHVRASTLTLQKLIGFDTLLEERGHAVAVDLDWSWGAAGERFAGVFGVDADLECLLIEKSYRADGKLALVVSDAIPRAQFAAEAIGDPVEPSLFSFVARRCDAPIHHAVADLVPMVKRGEETRLDIPAGSPYLRLHETHYSASAKPVAYTFVDSNDSFIRLAVVRSQ